MLFFSRGDVQPPMECSMPDKVAKKNRRLGEALVTEEDARIACNHVPMEVRDECIFDVLASNDKDMAGSY